MDTSEKLEALGTHFAVDVLERNGQKILLSREKLSQTTWLDLIDDQTTATLRKTILKTILPWVHPAGATVRCDGAAALVSLAKEAESDESVFHQFNIKLDVGRVNNPNKNSIAENAIKECEKEILRYRPHQKYLTTEDLAVVAKLMNDRVRNRGVTAKEVLTRRDCVTNSPKDIDDRQLAQQQFQNRLESNQQSQQRRESPPTDTQYHVGDVVFVRAQRSKHQPREQYIIRYIGQQ